MCIVCTCTVTKLQQHNTKQMHTFYYFITCNRCAFGRFYITIKASHDNKPLISTFKLNSFQCLSLYKFNSSTCLKAAKVTIITLTLTHSMVQSPSWEANRFAASQEIPRISRNPKVHYRTHKRLPPVSILGQPNLVHIPTSHFLEIHPNIIHPSTPGSPSLRFPHQDPIHPPSPHPYVLHAQLIITAF